MPEPVTCVLVTHILSSVCKKKGCKLIGKLRSDDEKRAQLERRANRVWTGVDLFFGNYTASLDLIPISEVVAQGAQIGEGLLQEYVDGGIHGNVFEPIANKLEHATHFDREFKDYTFKHTAQKISEKIHQ